MQIKKKFLKNFLIQELLGLITAIYIYFVRLTSSIKYEIDFKNFHIRGIATKYRDLYLILYSLL